MKKTKAFFGVAVTACNILGSSAEIGKRADEMTAAFFKSYVKKESKDHFVFPQGLPALMQTLKKKAASSGAEAAAKDPAITDRANLVSVLADGQKIRACTMGISVDHLYDALVCGTVDPKSGGVSYSLLMGMEDEEPWEIMPMGAKLPTVNSALRKKVRDAFTVELTGGPECQGKKSGDEPSTAVSHEEGDHKTVPAELKSPAPTPTGAPTLPAD